MATHSANGRKKLSARPFIELKFTAGKPSDHGFKHISELPPGERVISLCRESSNQQAAGLLDQELMIQKTIAAVGGVYLDLGEDHVRMVPPGHPKTEFGEQDNGHLPSLHAACNLQMVRSCHPMTEYGERDNDHLLLLHAVWIARELGASIVIESVSRVARNVHWQRKPRNWNEAEQGKWTFDKLQPTDDELADVAFILGDVKLYTLVPPDATADEERTFERKRRREGKRGSKKTGPKKKEKRRNAGWTKRNPELLAAVLELLAEGVGTNEVARQKQMRPQTVSDLKKKHFP